ncbi:DB module [Dictyocaulus viviparus]|uniref:DB module n=1 Tax=Dictyocaulus viviparus TaxID=29172 RepID=A0A0D8Y6M8_DICVI|nr:DB module [Dictyocaulus viviparus]
MVFILWFLLVTTFHITTADLPSCERARCSHCTLDFISKMCQKTCQECPRLVIQNETGKKLKVHPKNNQRFITSSYKTVKEVPENKSQKQQTINVTPRLSGVPTQTQPQASNVANQVQPLQQQPVPQSYIPINQFNQPPLDTSTLAPLIQPPRPIDINTNLAQRPAYLAQPLPEYQQQIFANQNVFNQQPTSFQASAQPQPYIPNQNIYGQPPSNAFGQPLYQAQTSQPLQFPQQQQQQTTQFLNPFQPFAQQPPAQQSVLDPFGLLNLVGMTPLAQGTVPSQSPATSSIYGQPQGVYGPITNQQPFLNSRPNLQQNPQTNYYGQQQIYNNQQPNQQNVESYQKTTPQQVTSNVGTRDDSSLQNHRIDLQQNRFQQGINGVNAQPNTYRTNQPYSQQPYQQGQVANVLPNQKPSLSIDPAPINVNKYVDGKGPIVTNLPQQCPRQPGWAPCITKEVANQRFANCCARLGEGCMSFCNYDAPLATMQLAVLTGRCPLNKIADIMVCASGYEDATPCCEAYNVFEPGYEHCRPYCNPAAGLPQGGLLSEKYKCLVKLSTIQQCFYVSQKP